MWEVLCIQFHPQLPPAIHTSPKLCECGKSFTQRYPLRVHQRLHAEEKPYACGDCGKSFPCKYRLRFHQKVHTERSQSVGNVGNRSPHCIAFITIRVHAHQEPHECSECEKCFQYHCMLLKHSGQVHSGEKLTNAVSVGDLSPLPTVFAIIRGYTREKESARTANVGNLSPGRPTFSGIRESTREKPYECSECGKCFTRKADLQRHSKLHTEERPC